MHTPVLLQEAIEHLVTDPEGCYVDATLGRGGHASTLLARLGAIDTMQASLDRSLLSDDELAAWMTTVNQLRLVLGTRLDIGEDDEDDDLDPAEGVLDVAPRELVVVARHVHHPRALAGLAQRQRSAGAEGHQGDGEPDGLRELPAPGGLQQKQGQERQQQARSQQHPQ